MSTLEATPAHASASSCTCVSKVNASAPMIESNTKLLEDLFQPLRTFVATYTEKKVRSKKAPLVAASYCPFCGVKYGPWKSLFDQTADGGAEAGS